MPGDLATAVLQQSIKACVAWLLVSLSLASAQAAERTTARVMLVHGVWASSIWEKSVRAELENALADLPGYTFEFAEQFLGFYSYDDPAPIERFSNHIEALIIEQDIDFVVCVMPAACEFMEPLDIADAHLVTIGARDTTVNALRGRDNATGILTPAADAIRETIGHARTLLGDDRRIHFLSGSGINDRRYARLAERLVADHYPDQAYELHIAMQANDLRDAAAALEPGRDVAFVLATEAYGEEAVSFPDGSLARTLAAATVPAFVFWDAALGTGVVGGSTVSAAGYASRARDVIRLVLDGEQPPNQIVSIAVPVYDAAQVERWGLDLSRLDVPVRLVNRTPGLWETNPALVVVSLATLALLLLVIALLTGLLQLNRRASRALAERERIARENEAKYRLVAETSADVIWTWDVERRAFTYCSPAIEALTGYRVGEFVELPAEQILPPASLDRMERQVAEARDTAVFELEHRHKAGGTAPVEVSLQVFRDEDGRPLRLVGVSRDIRDRKRREKKRAERGEQLRQRQKMESLGTLAAGIAHDFNNVLGVLTGLVDLQAAELGDNAAARELNGRLREATDRARLLVRRILTFSRQSAEQKTDVDLLRSLRASVEHIAATLPAGIDLQLDLPDGEGAAVISGDGERVEQALINLLTNAVEAIGEAGSVRVSLECMRPVVAEALDVGRVEPRDYARIRIEDTGPGIPDDSLPRVFEPFYTSKQLGSGIGLSIVHGVVTEHDGAIRVNSQAGQGTRFDIYLPLADASTAARVADVAPSSPLAPDRDPESRLRVLLIDDHEQLLDIVARMLRRLGHRCLTCNDPTRVAGILGEHGSELDVVISDYSMPGMSGSEIIEMCRREYPHLVAYLSTGYATPDARALARSVGAAGLLPKPMTIRDLEQAMRTAEANKRERRAG